MMLGPERIVITSRDALHEDGSSEVGETWPERAPESPRNRRLFRRYSRFHPPDDETVNNMELRELISRRSVQSVLHSDFRTNLDQFVRSVVNRQGQSPINWDLHKNIPIPASQDHDQRNEDLVGAVVRNSYYRRASGRHSELELEMINHVRADVARLEQGMSHMQAILEACMDKQIELQRSIRQEVAAALHEDGSNEVGETWSEGASDPPRNRRVFRRYSRFYPPDDEPVNNMELRELMSRRSVQSVLHSDFRSDLDQFVRSYVDRQGQSPTEWDLHRNVPIPASQDHDQRNEEPDDADVVNSYYGRGSVRHS